MSNTVLVIVPPENGLHAVGEGVGVGGGEVLVGVVVGV